MHVLNLVLVRFLQLKQDYTTNLCLSQEISMHDSWYPYKSMVLEYKLEIFFKYSVQNSNSIILLFNTGIMGYCNLAVCTYI